MELRDLFLVHTATSGGKKRLKFDRAIKSHEYRSAVKLGDKERFDKEQIDVKEPFPATNLPIYFKRIRNIWH